MEGGGPARGVDGTGIFGYDINNQLAAMDKTDSTIRIFGQEIQKMFIEVVDIYQSLGVEKPKEAVGRLTCYAPDMLESAEDRRRRPAVLILPGGGYAWTSRREQEPVALRYAARGWAAFTLEYTCARPTFPGALREAAMAMVHIRRNSARFGIDPHQVAAIGFSAGGHLCGMLGMLYDCPEVADIAGAEEIRPDALGLCYPVAVSWGRTHEESFHNLTGGDGALAERLSLERLVRPDMPPAFLWHTRSDGAVPCRNSLLLAAALEERGVDFSLHIYHRGGHGLSTVDELVYPTDCLPETSWDVPGWLEAQIRFFTDCGLKIQDYEVKG